MYHKLSEQNNQIWSHLLKKFLMENLIFCEAFVKLKIIDFVNGLWKMITLSHNVEVINSVALMPLLLTLNIFHTLF